MNPLIISCPIVGAELTKESYPYLPTTPDELASAAEGAALAGASLIHLHVRDEEGRPTQRIDLFEKVTQKIRERCDCIVQYSTGGAVGTPLSERCAPLKLRPEMATLSMGTLNFGPDIFENSEAIIKGISSSIQENGAMAELEIFDYGQLDTVERFLKKGWIPSHFHVDFVLGVSGGMNGEMKSLLMLVERLHQIKQGQAFTVAGVGRYQLPLATQAMTIGGHVRVGIEDNIFYRKGEMATSNAQLIKRIVEISRLLDRPIASVKDARQMLGLIK